MILIYPPRGISSIVRRHPPLAIRLFKIVNVLLMERIDASFIKAIWKAVAIQDSWSETRCISETNLKMKIAFNLCSGVWIRKLIYFIANLLMGFWAWGGVKA